jgi:molybdate transport repressor ModE-like protein
VPEVKLTAKVRVSLVGRRGVLDYPKIDFLRAIDRTGSLSAAAAGMGITYRTAWIRAREINEIWGAALAARTHGGKGGGGTTITPDGRSVLNWALRLESQPGMIQMCVRRSSGPGLRRSDPAG